MAHVFDCDCFECTQDNADVNTDTNPGYYIGSTLIAKKNITSYTLPKSNPTTKNPIGTVNGKFSPGETVGIIDSYVVDPLTNLVWWQLRDGKGWVQHFPGYFDASTAKETSSGKEFNDEIAATNKINLDPSAIASKIGEDIFSIPYLKWIIAAVVIVVLVGLFFRIKG